MKGPAPAGRRIEILFGEADVAVEIDHSEDDEPVARALLDALDGDDPDAAELSLRTHLGNESTITRRG